MPSAKSPRQPTVWISVSDVKSELVFSFISRMFEEERALLVERLKAFRRGKAFEADELPSEMWIAARSARDDARKLPHFVNAGGFLVVSGAVADVLSNFNLGQTRLHPVRLLHSNRIDAFPGKYFLLNISEVRRYFSSQHSVRFTPLGNHGSYVASVDASIEDGDISVNSAALNGPDLWIDDTIRTHFFCSDPLVQALRAAKLTSRLPIFRCQVLAAN